MLMRPNKAETAVHGCHCAGDMAVRIFTYILYFIWCLIHRISTLFQINLQVYKFTIF